MPRVRVKKEGAKQIPNNPAVEGNAGPEELKARKQARLAAARQSVIDASGPQRPLPDVMPTLMEDMKRAWQVEEHPLDGPGVRELRKICKEDFAEFMKMYRAEEAREIARKKAAGEGLAGEDAGTAAALELIEGLLRGEGS